MAQITAKMRLEKETDNSLRYKDASFSGIASFYIPKAVMYRATDSATWPQEITLTVDTE